MRTTITFDDDVAAAIAILRRREGIGVSEAVNRLVRDGLRVERPRKAFRQKTSPMGALIDLTNVAEALEVLDGATST